MLLEHVDAADSSRSQYASQEPTRLASEPTTVTANRLYSPFDTLKPANSIVASLGIGMQALSRSISTKTPGRPIASTTSTAKFDDRVRHGCQLAARSEVG